MRGSENRWVIQMVVRRHWARKRWNARKGMRMVSKIQSRLLYSLPLQIQATSNFSHKFEISLPFLSLKWMWSHRQAKCLVIVLSSDPAPVLQQLCKIHIPCPPHDSSLANHVGDHITLPVDVTLHCLMVRLLTKLWVLSKYHDLKYDNGSEHAFYSFMKFVLEALSSHNNFSSFLFFWW